MTKTAKTTMKKRVIDALTIISLLIGIGSGVMGFIPQGQADDGDTLEQQVSELTTRVADLENQIRMRDVILRQLAQKRHETASELYQALVVQQQDQLVMASAVMAAPEVMPTYEEFQYMVEQHQYPRIWYYYHYHIISLVFLLLFVPLGVMSYRVHFVHG